MLCLCSVVYIKIQSRTMIQIRDRRNEYFYWRFKLFSFEGLASGVYLYKAFYEAKGWIVNWGSMNIENRTFLLIY